jgi:hypothetical protein
MEIIQGIELTKYLGQLWNLTFFDHKWGEWFLFSDQNPFILGIIPDIFDVIEFLP